MGKPSTRIGDNHLCPMTDGPKPHVGGLVLPPGTPTVLVGGLPAATMGDMCLCVSPIPNSIALGSLGVFFGGRPAARMFDKTLHGGTLVKGDPTVLIGDVSAMAGPAIFPGKQNHANCGVQAMQQVIRQTTGVVYGEEELLHLALAGGFIEAKAAGFIGATQPEARHDMLAVHGVASTTVRPPKLVTIDPEVIATARTAHNASLTRALTQALQEGKPVLVGLDASQLWHGKPDGGGHIVLVYDADFDSAGNITHVYINDTSAPDPEQRQGYCVPAVEFLASTDLYVTIKGKPESCLNIIETPMWTSTPIDLDPPRLSGSPFGNNRW
ncbi:PAAR domain-containing protein [Hymenobacter terrenus]|uniref:PAAR domain-containing protein n=1 Tax=Hymenobacter terrenus TaxID=1629124 RepID=UPI000907F9B3|nr:PAAR domain-containing protein [Hymenobacter terrenus]